MIALYFIFLIYILGAIVMLGIGHMRLAGIINALLAAISLIATFFLASDILQHGYILSENKQFYIDAFSLLSIFLTTFITTTTAIFSIGYMRHDIDAKKITKGKLRLYHTLYQIFAFTMLLAASTNNIGILWVAMEGATLATVLLVSLYRTKEAVEAAWKYFILCTIGIALALFGTILVYSSATKLLPSMGSGILWSTLYHNARALDPTIVKLAFVFLLVGYGTKIGLVPLHNWLPDAHSESPAPMSALLSGLLLNLALYALVRFKILTDLSLGNNLAGNLMIAFGLLSFLVAVILLYRQKNLKRMFSYSSIEHMGLITFTFGLGGSLATFAALFYMLVHSLTKSTIFMIAGNAIQLTGKHNLNEMYGLIRQKPSIGWGLLIACLAISGFPPFGIFMSEVMLFVATVKIMPWVTILLVIGLLIALAGMLKNIQPVVYGDAPKNTLPISNMSMVILQLSLVFILGIYLPPALVQLLNQATSLIAVNI
jgi:hydrogenase-4 component F